jgi:predicted DNA-binding protein (UPF0251 family)
MKHNLIYGLRDPRNDVYYYIGKTTVGNIRALQHLTKSHNEKVNIWVKELEVLKLVPLVDIIEDNLDLEELSEREKYWINYYKDLNDDLFNIQISKTHINEVISEEDDNINSFIKVIFFIGQILKKERKARRLTQEEMADKMQISRSTLNLCENNSNVTLAVIKKYLTTLKGIDLITKNVECKRVRKK